jgi:hypothetical protein
MKRRSIASLALGGVLCALSPLLVRAQDDGERALRPPVRRVRGLRFTSVPLNEMREALRPTATTLHELVSGREHHYEQRGYRSRRTLLPTELGLATARTWGHPAPLDITWHESATLLPASNAANIADWHAQRCVATPSDDPITPIADPERAALQAFAAAFAAAASHPALVVVGICCGWADSVGALANGTGIVDPATNEIYWSYLTESWRD